jgi:uncharacterized protein (DUF4415 family)
MREIIMKKLSKQQIEELNLLANLPDDEIDTSDIPEQTNWDNAVIGKFYSKNQQAIRIDNEILTWFKSKGGRDYQHMINKALFDYVQQHNHA